MTTLRRIAALAVIALTGLPAAASATVTCPPTQPPLNAWAGSPKTLTIVPCTSTLGATAVTYAAPLPAPALGVATVPDANGQFVFTGTYNPNGSDPVGADTVNFTADDADIEDPKAFAVPISVNAAPVVSTTFTGKDLQPDTTLNDGRLTFDVFYKTPVTATATLTDPTPVAPLAAFGVRFRSGLGAVKTSAPTNAAGRAGIAFTPLVTDEYAFDVPALPGTFSDGFVFWVAPDWKIAKTFPVKNKKFVISGRLLAAKSVRSKGSYIQFQRAKGKGWVTIISRVPISPALTFTVKVKRSAFVGKKVRFLYVSKNVDYIGSSIRFTIKAKRSLTHMPSGQRAVELGARAAVSRALRG